MRYGVILNTGCFFFVFDLSDCKVDGTVLGSILNHSYNVITNGYVYTRWPVFRISDILALQVLAHKVPVVDIAINIVVAGA